MVMSWEMVLFKAEMGRRAKEGVSFNKRYCRQYFLEEG